jgi:DNA-binding response OmpR family regulator
MKVMEKAVLYVEDDADTRDLIQLWLGINGYSVTTACTVIDALALVRTGKFVLYILDNWLPDGNGIDLCQQIRVFDHDTPILFISGAAYPTDQEQAIDAGAQEYLTKPTDLEDLFDAVMQLTTKLEVDAADLTARD